jgi:hypothetical protein
VSRRGERGGKWWQSQWGARRGGNGTHDEGVAVGNDEHTRNLSLGTGVDDIKDDRE